jgi:ATP-binding cassette subfamily B multidrug efflux pump
MKQEELRSKLGFVPQKAVLFNDTIASNIRYGRETATDEEVAHAAETAQALEFILAMPDGFQTMIAQGGTNVSGGQKQRLAIARALVRRPEVLVLDDCTSSVDSLTEAEILRAVRRAAGCTCILITQRVSAAAAADMILVLEDGRAVGAGTHDTLVRGCAVYRDICIAQLGREAVGV